MQQKQQFQKDVKSISLSTVKFLLFRHQEFQKDVKSISLSTKLLKELSLL